MFTADLEYTTFTSLTNNEPPQTAADLPTVSKETFDRIMKIMDIFNLIFEAASVVLTFTSALIYALPNMRRATACYLVALNASDTLSGLLVVIRAVWHTTMGTRAKSFFVFF
ncbi:hypothetical protein BaRGS_00019620 [Batillaria attramentaria]|uniref:G-protein coupled receptors family 1 profile domain-containing protein n=1 Tax=Batillaria attramentaria TaxID=370345 RepID=A0ABD0KPY9_9CAEN